jgi:hypothetical protein
MADAAIGGFWAPPLLKNLFSELLLLSYLHSHLTTFTVTIFRSENNLVMVPFFERSLICNGRIIKGMELHAYS